MRAQGDVSHMANFTISSGDYIRPYLCPFGQPSIAAARESTSQTYGYGALLEIDSAGSTGADMVKIALSSVGNVISTAIIGIAAEPASSVSGTKRIYFTTDIQNQFWGRTFGATLNSSNVGRAYALQHDSTKNVWLVDIADGVSSAVRVVVTGLLDVVGDSGGAVSFKFSTVSL